MAGLAARHPAASRGQYSSGRRQTVDTQVDHFSCNGESVRKTDPWWGEGLRRSCVFRQAGWLAGWGRLL